MEENYKTEGLYLSVRNVIGELPLFVSYMSISSLLGPNPTGIIGLTGLLMGAIFIFYTLSKSN